MNLRPLKFVTLPTAHFDISELNDHALKNTIVEQRKKVVYREEALMTLILQCLSHIDLHLYLLFERVSALETSHLEMSPVNLYARSNAFVNDVTLDTSQLRNVAIACMAILKTEIDKIRTLVSITI